MSKSGYRFVPLNSKVVPAPITLDEIRHDRPVPGMLSGELTVEWTAETPICVASGEKNKNGEQENVFIADEKNGQAGKYVMPGSTPAGAIRAVSEIASFAHLGRINADRKYGKRDFVLTQPPHNPKSETDNKFDFLADQTRMGWLEWAPEESEGDKHWKKGPGKWKFRRLGNNYLADNIFLVKMTELLGSLGISCSNWEEQSLAAKAKMLAKGNEISPIDFNGIAGEYGKIQKNGKEWQPKAYKDWYLGEIGKSTVTGGSAYPVCTGPVPENDAKKRPTNLKSHEYLFIKPQSNTPTVDINPEIMKEFNKLYTTPSNDGGKPLDNWLFWLCQIGHDDWGGKADKDKLCDRLYDKDFGLRVPVFYAVMKGSKLADLEAASSMNDAGVCFSLSPVMRIPHRYSIGEIASRTYGRDGDKQYKVPEFSDGGLGWDMPTAMFGAVEGTDQDKLTTETADVRASLKGRVSFGFAVSDADKASDWGAKTGVFGEPRPSFEPFYLTGDDGFNDSNSRLSGRKRYPVRSKVNDFPVPDPEKTKVQETIRFLQPGTKFRQKIKFKNLKKEELGLLLWVLQFGEKGNDSPYRHAIGRAKGHGYGCMKTVVTKITSNNSAEVDTAIDAFKDYILKALGKENEQFERLEPIQKLLAYANPSHGDLHANQLVYPELKEFMSIRNSHQKLGDF